jgi:UDP-N-acetylglucosamine 2-epimerase (non-hydrolysing)
MNRQITSRIATYHFAPTFLSKKNLLNERVNEDSIILTGNTVIDALQWVTGKIREDRNLSSQIGDILRSSGIPAEKLVCWNGNNHKVDLNGFRRMVLITGHRRENFGQGFINICEAIKELALKYPKVDFVYPMHLNPNVRNAIKSVFGDLSELHMSNVFFTEPLDYLPFVYLMNKSFLVLTDSGGIQEEAPGLGKPVLVMRDTTERPEAVDAGTVKLVGTNKMLIVSNVSRLLDDPEAYELMSKAVNPYGDGFACSRIVEEIGVRQEVVSSRQEEA